jgi:hypothetical protein
VFHEVDVTDWEPGGPEHLGTKPKRWLVDGAGAMWLFKEVTHNRRRDRSTYAKGDDWSERVCAAIASELGIAAASVELAIDRSEGGRTYGVISKKILDESESLIHGNELLAEVGVVGSSERDRSGYTLRAVRQALEGVEPPVPGHRTAWDWFAGYLVLDALIGNTDRHQENWAVIGDGRRRLAPTFDHASSLGFLLDDSERDERLSTQDRNRTAAAYGERGRTKFEGGADPCAMAIEALALVDVDTRAHWVGRATALSSIAHLLERVPTHRASEAARRFAIALFDANRSRLLSHPLCTLTA